MLTSPLLTAWDPHFSSIPDGQPGGDELSEKVRQKEVGGRARKEIRYEEDTCFKSDLAGIFLAGLR